MVSAEFVGQRLDRILAAALQDISRARLQGWIKEGHVILRRDSVALEKISPSLCAQLDDEIFITAPEIRPSPLTGEAISLDILFEDEDILVLNKPAGLVVHPGAGHQHGTLVHALIAHCGDSLAGIGGERRPGIVHRLDKDTSGVMVVAKNDTAHLALGEQFKAHGRDGRLHRKYQAFVWGSVIPLSGSVSAALARSPHNRLKMAVSRAKHARSAVTHYHRLTTDPENIISHVSCALETGRTHQIRVHMAHIGFPVIADHIYGPGMQTKIIKLAPALAEAVTALDRQALHAAELGFDHPIHNTPMRFTAPLPPDMARIAAQLT